MENINNSVQFKTYTPQRVLAIGAHADDIDVLAAGTIAAWCKAGVHIEYVVMTDGGKGSKARDASSEDVAAIRQKEQQDAAKCLGAVKVHFLGYEDGNLPLNDDTRRDVVRLIRTVKPDTVVSLDPTFVYSAERGIINHLDHRACGQVVLDAVYPLARDHLSFPELLVDGYEPHKVQHVLLTNFDRQNYFVDISDTLTTKQAALALHKSQFPADQTFKEMIETWASDAGKRSGYTYAEGFVRIDLRF